MINRLQLRFSALLLIALGHFQIVNAQCATPTASTGNQKTDEIKVNWTPGTSADTTFVEYGLSGFTHGTGTVAILTPTFGTYSQAISGLSPNTVYEFCVYDICTNGDTSAPVCIIDSTLACPSAGGDTSVSVCHVTSTVSLGSLLNGADGTNGLFVDTANTGGVNKGDFLPSQVGPGTYHLLYMIGGVGCPPDSAWITLNVDTVPNPGLSATDTICDTLTAADVALYLGNEYDTGGVWVDVNTSGALSGTVFNPSQVSAGATYTFRYVLPGNSCVAGDSATVQLYVDSCSSSVGGEEYPVAKIEVYPNPSSGILYVENMAGGPEMNIGIYSNSGELLRRLEGTSGHRTELNLSDLPTGLYHIQISVGDYQEVHRFLKK